MRFSSEALELLQMATEASVILDPVGGEHNQTPKQMLLLPESFF